MNNTILVIIGLIIVLGGGYYFISQNSGGNENGAAMEGKNGEHMHEDGEHMHEEGEHMMEDGSMMEGDKMKEDGGAMVDVGVDVEVTDADVVFNITGKNFSFSETEMRVKEGQKVTVNFTSESGFHDWVVDEFSAATERVNSGGSTSVTFVADRTGEFEYYCSVGSHRALGMVGTLIVE